MPAFSDIMLQLILPVHSIPSLSPITIPPIAVDHPATIVNSEVDCDGRPEQKENDEDQEYARAHEI